MTPASVMITGIGVVSPLGCSVAELTRRFAAGERAVTVLDVAEVDGAHGAVVAEIPLDGAPPPVQRRLGRFDRISRLFLAASCLAVDAAALDMSAEDGERVGVSFGTGLGCLLTNAAYNQRLVEAGPAAASPQLFAYTVSSAAAGEVSIALGVRGANVTMHAGLAAGLAAIGYGVDLIRLGKADVVLAGGADALGPALLQGLEAMALLKRGAATPFVDAVPGVVPGEAAVIVVLESAAHAAARGARVWAAIEGHAAGFEPTLTRPDRTSAGIESTLRRALGAAGRSGSGVDVVLCSAHGTPVDAVEQAALAALCGGASPLPLVLAPKAAVGECFGASGPLGLALAVGLCAAPPAAVAEGLALEVTENGVRPAARVAARLGRTRAALIHNVCYSGPSLAMVVATPE